MKNLLLITMLLGVGYTQVMVEIRNVAAGTLDIYMTNLPGCSYCEDDIWTNQFDCETYGNSNQGANWIFSWNESMSGCESLNGNWFDGHIGGFQFELLGVTVTGASAPNGFTVSISATSVLGFSLTGATIPPGVNQLLTTVNFTYNEESSICFGEDTGSAGNNAISDANANYIAAAWGDCYCPDVNPADICGECGGSGIPDGECDCDGNVDLGCGCGEAGPSGCDNACGSNLEFDECGECGGSGIPDGECDCDGNVDLGCGCGEAGPSGCDNACNSTAVEDCDGICLGSSLLDCCGVCNGDNDSCELPSFGDMNNDSMYNILDIVKLANCVLASNCNNIENGCAGDLNGDGSYNVLDIVILANCVLANNCGD